MIWFPALILFCILIYYYPLQSSIGDYVQLRNRRLGYPDFEVVQFLRNSVLVICLPVALMLPYWLGFYDLHRGLSPFFWVKFGSHSVSILLAIILYLALINVYYLYIEAWLMNKLFKSPESYVSSNMVLSIDQTSKSVYQRLENGYLLKQTPSINYQSEILCLYPIMDDHKKISIWRVDLPTDFIKLRCCYYLNYEHPKIGFHNSYEPLSRGVLRTPGVSDYTPEKDLQSIYILDEHVQLIWSDQSQFNSTQDFKVTASFVDHPEKNLFGRKNLEPPKIFGKKYLQEYYFMKEIRVSPGDKLDMSDTVRIKIIDAYHDMLK